MKAGGSLKQAFFSMAFPAESPRLGRTGPDAGSRGLPGEDSWCGIRVDAYLLLPGVRILWRGAYGIAKKK